MTERTEAFDLEGQPYRLVLTGGHIRVLNNLDQDVLNTTTPFSEADLFRIDIQGGADGATLVLEDGARMRVTRQNDQWTLAHQSDLDAQAQAEQAQTPPVEQAAPQVAPEGEGRMAYGTEGDVSDAEREQQAEREQVEYRPDPATGESRERREPGPPPAPGVQREREDREGTRENI
jgi:hypothetical protein